MTLLHWSCSRSWMLAGVQGMVSSAWPTEATMRVNLTEVKLMDTACTILHWLATSTAVSSVLVNYMVKEWWDTLTDPLMRERGAATNVKVSFSLSQLLCEMCVVKSDIVFCGMCNATYDAHTDLDISQCHLVKTVNQLCHKHWCNTRESLW